MRPATGGEPPWSLSAPVVAAFAVLYLLTLAPDVLWGGGDFATYQRRACLGEVVVDGAIFDHPLWVLLAHPVTRLPLGGTCAWRANLAAAVFAVATLAFVQRSAFSLTDSAGASILAAAALGVSHTFWTYAVMAKVYSLNALLLAAAIYLLLRWRQSSRDGYLYAFAALYGVSFLNHLVMATAAAGFVAFILRCRDRVRGGKQIGYAALAFLAGVIPAVLVAITMGRTFDTVGTVLRFLAAVFHPLADPAALLRASIWGLALFLYQFPIAGVFGLWGLQRLWRQDRPAALLVGLVLAGTILFLISASDPLVGGPYVWNLHYYLQAYVVFSLVIAVGFRRALDGAVYRYNHRAALLAATLLLPAVLYASAPNLARHLLLNLPDFRSLPGRDNFTYVLSPWKQAERGPRLFGDAVLENLPPGAVLFADYSIWALLKYLQAVEERRPDLEIVLLRERSSQVATILGYRGRSDLYLADTNRYYDLPGIEEHFRLERSGPIFRLLPTEGEMRLGDRVAPEV